MRRRVNCASQLIGLILLAVFVQVSAADNSQYPHARLYFFTSPACGPCRQVEPAIQQLANEGYPVTIINTAAQPEWAQHFKVNRTPTTILVDDQKVIGRQTGLVSGDTLRGWFAACAKTVPQSPSPVNNQASNLISAIPAGLNQGATRTTADTIHLGTTQPQNQAELKAMKATVRIKVTDPQGASFATGTIIHRHQNECLVLTCGHVFRDSQGKGAISADYDFVSGTPKTAAGRLLSFDANDRDIALVTMTAEGFDGQPIFVAQPGYSIQNSDQAFSIGCDHGEAPTIRRTRIKNLAKYNGVEKYDIFGRPVDGRSGGGLFTPGGQLVGVCNAAAVDFDEGIYVALNTIYWQLEKMNLTNLFYGDNAIATNFETSESDNPAAGLSSQLAVESNRNPRAIPSARDLRQPGPDWTNTNQAVPTPGTAPQPAGALPQEAIVILRSNHPSEPHRTLTISNPPQELLKQIYQASEATWQGNSNRIAKIRNEMPLPAKPDRKSDRVRSQSPR